MKDRLCSCMAHAVIETVYAAKTPEYDEDRSWQEIWCDDDYAEMVLRIRRWYDQCGEISNADVIIECIVIWDNDNNDTSCEEDYRQLCRVLNGKGGIDCSYEYEQGENDRLLQLFESSICR